MIEKTRIADLEDELLRLKSTQASGKKSGILIIAIVIICIITIVSILAVALLRPYMDNTSVIATIVGVTSPILVAFLAAAVQQVHLAVNSRLTQLLELTATSSKARGVLIERDRHSGDKE